MPSSYGDKDAGESWVAGKPASFASLAGPLVPGRGSCAMLGGPVCPSAPASRGPRLAPDQSAVRHLNPPMTPIRSLLVFLVVLSSVCAQRQDPLYDKTKLRDFYFTFAQPNWWTLLVGSAGNNNSIKGDLKFDGVTYKDIGLKVKGFTSSSAATKKPFNLSMDAFVPGQKIARLQDGQTSTTRGVTRPTLAKFSRMT